MTTSTAASVHFSPGEVGHRWNPSVATCSAYGTLHFGTDLNGAKIFVSGTGDVDEIIAELVALRAEMTAETAAGRFARISEPVAVITDSERTCDQKHPQTGAWCHRGGAHAEHRDTDGETWTDPAPELTVRERAQRGARKAAEREAAGEPAPNPPHHITGTGEQACAGAGWNDGDVSGYVCTAQDGHDGPDHIAYKPNGGEYHRWPVAAAPDQLKVSDETIAAARSVADDIEAGTWPPAEPAPAGEGGVLFPAGDEDEAETAGPPYAGEGIDGLRWDNMSSSGSAS